MVGKCWAPLEECAESQAGRAEGTAVLAWLVRRRRCSSCGEGAVLAGQNV